MLTPGGVVIGLAGALRYAIEESMLYGVRPTDTLTFGGMCARWQAQH